MISEKLAKLGNREKLGLAVATVCVCAMLLDRLVVDLVAGSFKRMNAGLDDTSKKLFYNYSVLQGKEEVSNAYNRVSLLLGTSKYPDAETDDMSVAVYDLARSMGISCQPAQGLDPVKTARYQEFSVEIGKFEAEMKDLLAFLHEIAKPPGTMGVTKLSFSADKESNKVNGSMVITKVMMIVTEVEEETAAQPAGESM